MTVGTLGTTKEFPVHFSALLSRPRILILDLIAVKASSSGGSVRCLSNEEFGINRVREKKTRKMWRRNEGSIDDDEKPTKQN